MINNFLHWLSHLFGRNTGSVASWIEGDFIYVGFQCDHCKKIDESSVDKVPKTNVIGREIEIVEEPM